MVKNTGIPENQLSDLDFGQVLKDSHNKPLHALDVNQINSLVPSKFSKVIPSYDDYGRISSVKYYGLGLPELIKLTFPSDFQGTSEYSTFVFTSQTPAGLAGKYVTIYDSVGKVVIWFDLDNGSVQPVVAGSTRYIEVDIATGDTSANLASKFSSTVHTDSEFNAQATSTIAVVQTVTKGNFTDATIGNTTLLLSITQGIDTPAGHLFYLNTYDNTSKYAFYFKVDGVGTEPAYTGLSITPILILSSDTIAQIATKVATVINSNQYFVSSATNGVVFVDYRPSGNTSGFLDSNSRLISETIQDGSDMELVQEIIITYTSAPCGQIESIQALL